MIGLSLIGQRAALLVESLIIYITNMLTNVYVSCPSVQTRFGVVRDIIRSGKQSIKSDTVEMYMLLYVEEP